MNTTFLKVSLGLVYAAAGYFNLTPAAQPKSAQSIPIAIIGGWSNHPEDYVNSPAVNKLREARGDASLNNNKVFLARHLDPWGDVDANAVFEAAQLRVWLDSLNGIGAVKSTLESLPDIKKIIDERGRIERDGKFPPKPTVVEFDLVGHSMGGLVARAILTKHAELLGPYRVRRLIELGSPNHGANTFLTYADIGYGPSQGHSPIAAQQMRFDSAFLTDINTRQIPALTKVITISGNIRAQVPTSPPAVQHPGQMHDTGVMTPCAHPVLVQDKLTKAWLPKVPPEVQHPGGDPVTAPCTHIAETDIHLGSDGFIRVKSVALGEAEAANFENIVFSDVYHTDLGTRDMYLKPTNPKILIDARDRSASEPGVPVLGKPMQGSYYFDDQRVTDILNRDH